MPRGSVIFLWLVRAILQIVAILLAVVAAGLGFSADTLSDANFIGGLLFGIFALIPGGAAAGLMFLSRKLGQRIYDIEAATLFKEIVEGKRKSFSVFLRPFYVTNKLLEVEVSDYDDIENPITFLKSPISSLEVGLVRAMRWTSPVVGLGRPGEALGVGRILTNEEDWRAAVTGLIDCAEYIFCIPSGHPGTLWEIDHIVEHSFLTKTVFIMPPLPETFGGLRLWRKKKVEVVGLEEDWANLFVEMKKRGLSFPNYDEEGMLFSIKSANSVDTQTFTLASPRSIKRGVKALVTAQ